MILFDTYTCIKAYGHISSIILLSSFSLIHSFKRQKLWTAALLHRAISTATEFHLPLFFPLNTQLKICLLQSAVSQLIGTHITNNLFTYLPLLFYSKKAVCQWYVYIANGSMYCSILYVNNDEKRGPIPHHLYNFPMTTTTTTIWIPICVCVRMPYIWMSKLLYIIVNDAGHICWFYIHQRNRYTCAHPTEHNDNNFSSHCQHTLRSSIQAHFNEGIWKIHGSKTKQKLYQLVAAPEWDGAKTNIAPSHAYIHMVNYGDDQ